MENKKTVFARVCPEAHSWLFKHAGPGTDKTVSQYVEDLILSRKQKIEAERKRRASSKAPRLTA